MLRRPKKKSSQFQHEDCLLDEVNVQDPCLDCGGDMTKKKRKSRNGKWFPILCCVKKATKRNGNEFFDFTALSEKPHSNLTLSQIIELSFICLGKRDRKIVSERERERGREKK